MSPSIVLTRSRLLALAVLLLAVGVIGALLVTRRVHAAETEAVLQSASEDAQVTAGELAQWIVEKRQDYQLLDLREPWQFHDYHIPTAINIPFAELFRGDNFKRLDKQKKIIVYGLGAGRSAQAQLLLSMKGHRAYALEDGIIGWWDEIMTPTSLRSAKPSSSGYQQSRQLREHFTTGAPAPSSIAVPAVPSAPAATVAPLQPAKSAAKPAKSAAKPAAKAPPKPAKPPADDTEKKRLKLGVGCS